MTDELEIPDSVYYNDILRESYRGMLDIKDVIVEKYGLASIPNKLDEAFIYNKIRHLSDELTEALEIYAINTLRRSGEDVLID